MITTSCCECHAGVMHIWRVFERVSFQKKSGFMRLFQNPKLPRDVSEFVGSSGFWFRGWSVGEGVMYIYCLQRHTHDTYTCIY